MATIPGTYVKTGMGSSERINAILDIMLAPNIIAFRQIDIHHEQGERIDNKTFKFSYQNWNEDFKTKVFLNNNPEPTPSTDYTIDHVMGQIIFNDDTTNPGDFVLCTYNFDYFSTYFLEGFIIKAVDVTNTAGVGSATTFNIDDAPVNWDGVITDLVLAMCMERLILDYDLWKGRLIFAISPGGLIDGSDSIVSQLETIKHNAEDRAYKSIDNEKFKNPDTLAGPTTYYYQALRSMSNRRGAHGIDFHGKMRGFQANKFRGFIN